MQAGEPCQLRAGVLTAAVSVHDNRLASSPGMATAMAYADSTRSAHMCSRWPADHPPRAAIPDRINTATLFWHRCADRSPHGLFSSDYPGFTHAPQRMKDYEFANRFVYHMPNSMYSHIQVHYRYNSRIPAPRQPRHAAGSAPTTRRDDRHDAISLLHQRQHRRWCTRDHRSCCGGSLRAGHRPMAPTVGLRAHDAASARSLIATSICSPFPPARRRPH